MVDWIKSLAIIEYFMVVGQLNMPIIIIPMEPAVTIFIVHPLII